MRRILKKKSIVVDIFKGAIELGLLFEVKDSKGGVRGEDHSFISGGE